MDKIFEVDFKKLAQWMLPFKLRKEVVLAFLYAILLPVISVYDMFTRSRNQHLYRLKITGQVCFLEKYLNDRYDIALRRIRIVDGAYSEAVYLFLRAENRPLYLFTRAENKPVYLFTRGETNSVSTDFLVVVPEDVKFNENQLRGEIDSYKLAGMKYELRVKSLEFSFLGV